MVSDFCHDSLYHDSLRVLKNSLPNRYFGWDVVKSFWTEAVPDKGAKILCPGVGNDPSLFELVTAGWRHVTAFDYSVPPHFFCSSVVLRGPGKKIVQNIIL